MSRYHSYLNTAKTILEQYHGKEPFASFLKNFFSQHKKYGSKDRKTISHICFCFFRTAPPPPEGGIREFLNVDDNRLLESVFLCSTESNEILSELKPEWNSNVHLPLTQKISIVNCQLSIENVFPWKEELSNGVEYGKFCESFFIQPDLFLRLRPGYEDVVKKKLSNAGIDFETISGTCLALPNSSKLESVIDINKEAVIQDLNSQKTSHLLQSAILNLKSQISAWDCCAASGGKSIMLYDYIPGIDLTVSDIRPSIIANLKKRFFEAGINDYKPVVVDLSKKENIQSSIFNLQFSIILCDVPCTGSGTWSRTPEQRYFFNHQAIEQYSHQQRKIVSNIIPYLRPGGYLLYITCSVFRKENEEVIEAIQGQHSLELVRMELLKGYDKKADTMFAALLQKPL